MSFSPLHYRVECAMCTGSLIVESDSLQEIFRLLKDHLEKENGMHEAQPAKKQNKLGKRPHTNREIFESNWFRWDILSIQPLERVRSQVDQKDLHSVLM